MPAVPSVSLRTSSFQLHRRRFFAAFWLIVASLLTGDLSLAAVSLNVEEQKLAQLLTTSSGQRRDRTKMYADERLCQVARARAMDMARRKYFDHVNPDGEGPNYLVRRAGYPLPSHYSTSKSGNNIESIGCGYSNASEAWSGWMGSSGHKTHLLATESFYRDQTAMGVGYYYDPDSPYGRYYVVLTAPPAGDTLTITSPASGARVVTNQVTVTGQVSGAEIVGQMVYRLENATGAGAWKAIPVPSGSGVANWSANVGGLAVGANTVRVRTLNDSGAVMKEAARSVRLAVLRPLTVEVSGEGAVTAGFAGLTQREVGRIYSITATPRAESLFSHWEGFPPSETRDLTRRTQSFVMAEGLVLRANFIPNPFLDRNGAYEGLVIGSDLNHGTTGILRLTLARTGGFSGQLILGPSRLTVRGTLNSAGTATVEIVRAGQTNLILTLRLDLTSPTQFLSATLSDAVTTWEIQADKAAPMVDETEARRITFRIDPNLSALDAPQGYGFGAATITASNTVTVTGKLADGRPLSAKGMLAANGNLAVYAPQFGSTGAFAAALNLGTNGVLTGTGRWHRPARPGDARYPAGFDTSHLLHGGLYVSPAVGTPALPWEPNGNGVLTLSSGDLSSPLVQALSLSANNLFTWTVSSIPALRITAVATTGNVAGSFRDSDGMTRRFRGVMIQQLGGAWGHFLGDTNAGAVALTAADE